MHISIVAALSENHVIGIQGRLPWRLPEDLKRFQQLTLGKTVFMGRKTFESIGKPLKKRRNLVLSQRLPGAWSQGVEVFAHWDEALQACTQEELFVIGGEGLYSQALPLAQTLYLTLVHRVVEGDTWFPAWGPSLFSEVFSEKGFNSEENLAYTFLVLKRC
jgi:dihydrofolate reductase